ncbi:MAG: hypothetical protein WA945_03685 [Arcobacteraceae bacterium]
MLYFMKKMKTVISISLLVCSTTAFALSEQALEGKELYMEADCMRCHGILPQYDPKENKAKNFNQIVSWVSGCDGMFDIGWFPEEQETVAQYLNELYYKHEQK